MSGTAKVKTMTIEDRLYKTRYRCDHVSHLVIKDMEVCRACKEKPCTTFCPASVYSFDENMIKVGFEGCFECGTCRIGCPYGNIQWNFPKGGYGVCFKNG
jgi:ferredoxin like protein